MTQSATTGAIGISAWSAVSPYGIGTRDFHAGLAAGRSAVGPVDHDQWPVPADRAAVVPDFDARQVLGRKGTRSMDRATGLAVAAVGALLRAAPLSAPADSDESVDPVGGDADGRDVAIVLGTTTGSAQSIMEFTRESLIHDKPYHVDPARFPNTIMNYAAGQSAIWHGLRGPNVTVAAGRCTGLAALRYAARLLRCGHARYVLCGAVEEFSVQRSWLEWHARGRPVDPLGEGCAMLLVEPADQARAEGRRPLATLEGLRFRAPAPGQPQHEALARCMRSALDTVGWTAEQLDLVVPSGAPDGAGMAERSAIAAVIGDRPSGQSTWDLLGDTGAASAAFQLAAVLVASGPARRALVTSVDGDGLVGCVLLSLSPTDGGRG